jgi:L-fuconolactonase
MTVVDAHHHVWDLAVRDQPWIDGRPMAAIRRTFTVDDLRPAALAAGVGATVAVQTVTVPEETPELLALAEADPLVAGVVGWTDLTSPAAAVPGLTLVLDHAGKPPVGGDLGAWAAAVRALAALPNTACKLSGLVTEAPRGAPAEAFAAVADVVLDAFGADRVMFGSDWPVCLLGRDYPGVMALARSLTAGLSPAERTAVFGATAARAYGLGGVAEPGDDAGDAETRRGAGAAPWH